MSGLATLEARFFRALNAFVEPMARAGCGSPSLAPTGLIAMETTGRRTGLTHRIPVLATLIGDHLLITTIRGNRSQWIKNVRMNPHVRYWLSGRVHEAKALVFIPGKEPPDTPELPPLLRGAVAGLHPLAAALGVGFAILEPQ